MDFKELKKSFDKAIKFAATTSQSCYSFYSYYRKYRLFCFNWNSNFVQLKVMFPNLQREGIQ